MNKDYCDKCQKYTEYKIVEKVVNRNVDNFNVEYVQRKNICIECNNEYFNEDVINFNVNSFDLAYNKIFDIININEIKEILEKYNIGKKPLAKILNWGETTIIRYLNGQNPDRAHSDILKTILNSPHIMENYLYKNKNNISESTYNKVKSKIRQIKLEQENSKLYVITTYILKNINDITPLALQKLLYFIQGFSKYFIGYTIFNDKCEAWVNGPVYREIYDIYSYYQYNIIKEENNYNYTSILTDNEIELINEIIKDFGCYSGDILMYMTHLTDPWIKSRTNLYPNDKSNKKIDINLINKYFEETIIKYKIKDIKDIRKFSCNLFKIVLKMQYIYA